MGKHVSRRGFVKWLAGGVFGITTLAFTAPVVRYLIPNVAQMGTNFFTNASGDPVKADEIKEGASFIGLSKDGPTIIVRREGKLHALSAVCTHLGCLVKWVPSQNIFFCPCHAGKFDANGVNIGGPPPSPLATYKVETDSKDRILIGDA